MFLTIIIPTINRPSLSRAIESIENQTQRTNYIVAIDADRAGPGPTRNQAIKEVKTEWVGFLDDDDWLDTHYHEWLKKEAKGYDMVIFRMKNSPLIEEAVPLSQEITALSFNQVGISFALKTEIAKKFPFRVEIPGEDFDLICRLREAGYKIKISQRVAYFIGDLKD